MEDNNCSIDTRLAEEIISDAYVELAKYTAHTRNYPGLIDGMKTVYRRLIYQSRIYNNRVKSASIVGDLLKIHPHGDESAYSVLVESTCKYNSFPLFEGKGNFGGLGFGCAAMRYTEAKLSDIARLIYLDLIDYAEYIEGEVDNKEPAYLPALIPYCFLAGSSGFSVGLPAPNIPPLNCMELVNYYIDLLEGNPTSYPSPDYKSVILNCDKEEYSDKLLKDGSGQLWFEPFIIQESDNRFVITQPTPNSNISRANKKVQWYLDQGLLDFSDETNEDGYRYVYTIVSNKVDPEDIKSKLRQGLSGSTSYRIIVEHNSTVYWCNFDYIVKHQLKYLRQCVIRKYNDYLSKSIYRSDVLKAINDLRNSDIITKLHTLTTDELKSQIVSWGYSEKVASEVAKKPISYLTKSHDHELTDEDKNRELYQSYIDNPNKYLLEKYYQLKDMITPIYNSRVHSVFKNDVLVNEKNKCQLSEDHKFIQFGLDKDTDWKSSLFIITKNANIKSMIVNKINMSDVEITDLDDNDEAIKIVGDNCKYIIFTIWNHIYVIPTNKIRSGYSNYMKLWSEDQPVLDAFGYNGDDLLFIDDHNNEITIHCEDYVKSRISKPQYVTRNSLKYYVNEDGDRIEINNGI